MVNAYAKCCCVPLEVVASERPAEIPRDDHALPGVHPDAYRQLDIFQALLGGTVLRLASLGFTDFEACIEVVTTLQALAVISPKRAYSTLDLLDNGDTEEAQSCRELLDKETLRHQGTETQRESQATVAIAFTCCLDALVLLCKNQAHYR
jgi:hypothetical protein